MIPTDNYDKFPSGMREYLSNYGFTFSKKAYECAVKLMKGRNGKLQPMEKKEVEEFLERYGVHLEKNKGYNAAFVLSMAKADFWQSSITEEQKLALYVKDYIDDEDGTEEVPFRRWLATMVAIGEPVNWEDML